MDIVVVQVATVVQTATVVVAVVVVVQHAAHVIGMTTGFTVSSIVAHLSAAFAFASIHHIVLVVVHIMDRTCGSWRVSS